MSTFPDLDTPMADARKINPVYALAAIVLLAFAWRAIFIYRPIGWLTNFWLFEDFGYSLKIAKNIALGFGETFDGVIWTNGYQPLYVWLMVPAFWIFPDNVVLPVYMAETLLAACNSVTVVFLYLIVAKVTGRPWSGIAAALIWAMNLAVARNGSLGLEAGLATMMIAATAAYVVFVDLRQGVIRQAFALGALLGVSFLARVDAVFLVVATSLYFLLLHRSPLKVRLRFLIIALTVFLAFIAPYCLWNVIHYGSPLPTSGQVTTHRSSLLQFWHYNLSWAGLRNAIQYGPYIIALMLAGHTSVGGFFAYSDTWSRPIAIITVATLVGSVIISYATYAARRREILFVAMLGAFYGFAYTIYSFQPYERYFLPSILIWTMFATIGATALIDSIRSRPRLRTAIATLAIVTPLVCFGVASKAKLLDEETPSYGWYDGVQVLNHIASPGDVVAAIQTGNTGYFYNKGRAINLDGVVNMAAYHAYESKTMDKYLAENNVRYMADLTPFPLLPSLLTQSQQDAASLLARMSQVFATPTFEYVIYRIDSEPYRTIRKPPLASGWTDTRQTYAIFGHLLLSGQPQSVIRFTSDRSLDLRFLRNRSAGIANIYRDGKLLAKIDLYAPVVDTTYKWHVAGDQRAHEYAVEVASEKNAASANNEVGFDAILER
jgi:4-amino-4-deoxy-L-arabinose transferase-like glycosyltransferase